MSALQLNATTGGGNVTITVPTSVTGTNTITVPASTGTVALTASPTFTGTTTTGAQSVGGNITFSSANAGVVFNKTGALTNSTLNDYEEGTWTPTITPGTGSITTYSASGTYTKVGRIVTLQAIYTITTNGTGASYILIGNIPFAGSVNTGAGIMKEIAVTGITAACYLTNSTTLLSVTYNNGYPGGTGQSWVITVVYYA